MNEALIAASVAGLVVATVLPLSKSEKWWIRVLDFPRLQLFVLSLGLLALQAALAPLSSAFSLSLVACTALVCVYQLSWILPYTRLVPAEVRARDDTCEGELISLLCANVLTPNDNFQGLIDLVEETSPDLVLTLETDQRWENELQKLESKYPHTMKCPLDNLFGMHLYSRHELQNAEISFLVEDDIPSFHCEIALNEGLCVQAHFLHPVPPVPEYTEESLGRDVELIKVAKQLQDSDLPIIVAGDLNDVAWSETTRLFRKISGLLDPRIGRGMFNTFHADYWFLRWPLDHIFHSEHFTVSKILRLPRFGSDHFALLTELCFQPRVGEGQSGLENQREDEKTASEKIQKAESGS